MSNYLPGQRWISDAELKMGLGTVLSVEHRMLTMLFPASGETRMYAKQTAPLTRVMFVVGDTVRRHDGLDITVTRVEEDEGLLTYFGSDADGHTIELPEELLDNQLQLNRPSERLFSRQIDPDKWFELRYRSAQEVNRLAHSDLRGLSGCRTSLIPHQLYIAHEVANRYAPRVLLADEVGLGKTIEAGLILHHQLLTERARRVLIVVPETLVHQWLVEMLRRFNLAFSIYDEERCEAQDESSDTDNPFHAEQLVLCNLEFLASHPERVEQALQGDWDLLVVDEAHHLQWSEQQASLEYTIIESLAARTKGVLLLTATPEQLGKASHFARLRLLDPDRFPDFENFLAEENSYEPIAQVVEHLLNDDRLLAQDLETLRETLGEGDNQSLLDCLADEETDVASQHDARQKLVEHLLDRHGTGRVLYRNTRAAVKGFPQRKLLSYALPAPAGYARLRQFAVSDPTLLLAPELLYQATQQGNASSQKSWTQIDPRVGWLIETLQEFRQDKILVITASAQTALDLAKTLKRKTGLHAAVFHEGLSIVERDRAAAYFADRDNGSQVLICSEIGSEGRNFQFAHQMILFDLPLNPDLLEQRIGRLDRIGQTETIRIHVPYIQNSAQASLFHWYHNGLDAFEHTCPAGHSVFVKVKDMLLAALHQDEDEIIDLIALSRRLHQEMNDTLQRGRDRLLEYNSCRPLVAQAIKSRAESDDQQSELEDYMDSIFDCFGINTEDHGEACFIISPSEYMLSPFPGLSDEGMTITYDRATALSNEDVHYLSWDHPMVNNAIDMVLSSELGNTAVTAVKYSGSKPGTLLLECIYVLESSARNELQLGRYLPPTTVRVVIDEQRRLHGDSLTHQHIVDRRALVDKETAQKVVAAKSSDLRALLRYAEAYAAKQAPEIISRASKESVQTVGREINRLKALQQVNPNVRDDELDYFEQQLSALTDALASASLRLDALRVVVAT